MTRKVFLHPTEWFPVYIIEEEGHADDEREITEDLIARAEAAYAEHEEVQRLLEELWESGKAGKSEVRP